MTANVFFSIVSQSINWLPFVVLSDVVISVLYPHDTVFSLRMFGIMEHKPYQLHMMYIVAVCISLSLLLFVLHRRENEALQRKLKRIQQNMSMDRKLFATKRSTAQFIHQSFPNTTRIFTGEDYTILLIGTSHLSALSAIECSELIRILQPQRVVIELDEMRERQLTRIVHDKAAVHRVLARDLFRVQTYLNPIYLFMRVTTRCTQSIYVFGYEFVCAAQAARSVNSCELVYGDQRIANTANSIRESTPWYLRILLNICFAVPMVSSALLIFWRTQDIIACIQHRQFIQLLVKVGGATMVWLAVTGFLRILVQVMAETPKKKFGMSKFAKLVCCVSYMCPLLAKVMRSSDVKRRRDEMLLRNTIEAARSIDDVDEDDKVVISVVGLAHMNDMYEIAKQRHLQNEIDRDSREL